MFYPFMAALLTAAALIPAPAGCAFALKAHRPSSAEGVGMALGTVGCALSQRPTQPASDVLSPRDRLQVAGVHAAPIPAKVVKLLTIGHGADVVLVCPAVPDDGLAAFQAEPSVATWQDVAGPVPATRSLINFVFPVKPLNGRRSLARLCASRLPLPLPLYLKGFGADSVALSTLPPAGCRRDVGILRRKLMAPSAVRWLFWHSTNIRTLAGNYQYSVWDDNSFKADPFALIDVVTCSSGSIWRGKR